jgi:outer membrane protein TolC
MKLLVLVPFVLPIVAGNQEIAPTLTFEDAVVLVGKNSPAAPPVLSDIGGLRSRLPNVRVETTGNTSRTLDFFSEGPFEVRYASSVLAFDFPLWDGGAANAHIASVEAKLRRMAPRDGIDDARFAQLLDAFSALYLAQKESDVIGALSELLSAEESRSARLLAAGEMTNLAATERSEIALAFRSRLLEIQARRIDAAARLRLLTGAEAEPQLVLDLSQPVPAMMTSENATDDSVRAATVALETSRARLREVTMFSGFRATLSGFGGFGGASSRFRDISSQGSFGVYGLRLNLSYPLLRGGGGIAVVEARADVAQSVAIRDAAVEAARLRAAEYRLREETSRRRIALLQQSIEVAKQREESLQRLVSAGIRSESDLAQARGERVRRQADLLAAQIERWKAARLLARMTTAESQSQP